MMNHEESSGSDMATVYLRASSSALPRQELKIIVCSRPARASFIVAPVRDIATPDHPRLIADFPINRLEFLLSATVLEPMAGMFGGEEAGMSLSSHGSGRETVALVLMSERFTIIIIIIIGGNGDTNCFAWLQEWEKGTCSFGLGYLVAWAGSIPTAI